MKMEVKAWRLVVMLAALGCYVAALYLPAFSFTSHIPPDPVAGEVEIYTGGFVLAFGPMGVAFIQLPAVAWLANCTFLSGMMLFVSGDDGKSAALAIASALLGASFFWISKSHPMPVLFSGRDDYMNHPIPMIGFAF